jgi:hypothetical protein
MSMIEAEKLLEQLKMHENGVYPSFWKTSHGQEQSRMLGKPESCIRAWSFTKLSHVKQSVELEDVLDLESRAQ